jgi:hypothetical protein
MRALPAALAAALVLASPAAAGTGLLLGVSDDLLKWTKSPAALLRVDADPNVQAVRITLPWSPGEWTPGRAESGTLQRAAQASRLGLRVVVAVYGPAGEPPADDRSREQFCSFVAGVVQRVPSIGDVVVWNEPNSSAFWRPQQGAPAAYEALLARCWDAVHAVRSWANVIAATAPSGTTGPAAWYRAVGQAYRASGRALPILDTVGHNAYPVTDGEAPAATHLRSSTIAEGDYDALMAALTTAFRGTAQPLPGQGRVRIWYMEDGFQTRSPLSSAYTGVESDAHAVSADIQAERLTQAIEFAYCQPAVGAFFNFQLVDERSLAGWQSGLLYADGTPKPAYAAFQAAAAAVRAGAVRCPQAQ